ncbi:hypothetical protein TgHK011_002741 [Trichoderma gracile]|nr:hypothetical protein TgHK011_002741 [Trichoderma gracile]
MDDKIWHPRGLWVTPRESLQTSPERRRCESMERAMPDNLILDRRRPDVFRGMLGSFAGAQRRDQRADWRGEARCSSSTSDGGADGREMNLIRTLFDVELLHGSKIATGWRSEWAGAEMCVLGFLTMGQIQVAAALSPGSTAASDDGQTPAMIYPESTSLRLTEAAS